MRPCFIEWGVTSLLMNKLKIKTETLAQRCEICHQADCFDPERNYCTRCAGVETEAASSLSKSGEYIEAVNQARNVRTGGIVLLACLAATYLLWGKINSSTGFIFLMSISLFLNSLKIWRVLRNVSSADPDWSITRQRTLSGMLTSATAGLLALVWILLWIFIF
jgi:hypothetical protein